VFPIRPDRFSANRRDAEEPEGKDDFDLKKRFYIVFVSRDEDGTLNKLPVPLHYAYMFVGAAVIGLFTITGMAGSYSRMLLKTARFNQMRQEQNSLRKDYANLEKVTHEKDVQVASLGSLASEVSALYGLTVNKLTTTTKGLQKHAPKSAGVQATAQLVSGSTATFTEENYYKSVEDFYALRSTALNGSASRVISGTFSTSPLHGLDPLSDLSLVSNGPSLWPVMGPITSPFGQREDPILGAGEGEFHKGVDISAPQGTPIHAAADGVVETAAFGNGYGREVMIDHGNGIKTLYGHMSGFAVVAGQQVTRGQVIGFVGSSGRTTGYHCHYEVRIRNTPVNPHKYLRSTMADVATIAR